MSSGRMVVGVVICVAASFVGCTVGLAMGGFGICAVSFTPSLVAVSAVIGALFGGTMALVWRKAWWSGALAFSVPSLLVGSFGWSSGQWQRVMGVGLCILAAGFAAFVVRYPGPRNLKQ